MKHRGASHSLHPARMQARTTQRQLRRTDIGGGPSVMLPGGWRLTTLDGALAAVHDETGTTTRLAAAPGEQQEGDGS